MSGKELAYLVIKDFKYGGKEYKPGEFWKPGKGNFDSKIIENQTHIRTIDPNVETRRSRMTGSKYGPDIVRMKDKDDMTFRKIADKLHIHYSTASRIYKREKEKGNGK